MRRLHAALLASLLASAASAHPLATFDDGLLSGTVVGSSVGPSSATCQAGDAVAPANRPGSARVIPSPTALLAEGAAGDAVLQLATGDAASDDGLAQTRWSMSFEARESSVLNLRLAFVTTDGAAFGDWWMLLLDGEPFACGDVAGMAVEATGVLAPGDRATAWMDLGGGLPLSPGAHVLEAVVGDGVDSTGASSILLDDIRLHQSLVPTPCRPAPPEDVGEIPYEPGVNPRRWIFDDNRFCSAGPQLGCARCLSGAPTPCQAGDPEVNPNTGFVDSTNRSFEMYVVADCGRVMHVPLFDVESGCISVFDENRFPIAITVTNNAGFNASGGEVCWNATNCTGGGANDPGGPGDQRVMDVAFAGDPALCGVYILNFRSWAGCIWDLFANCNGTGSEGFEIHDNFCSAQAAVNRLPEIVIESLVLTSGVGCFVDYCATVRNIGCLVAPGFILHVENEADANDHALTLGPGFSAQVCGRLDVVDVGPVTTTVVTATVDYGDLILECTENPSASACDPEPGADQRTSSIQVECNHDPTCDAGGPYAATCPSPGTQFIQLDGTGSSDPDGDPLTYLWTTTCPGATFNDATSATPILRVPSLSCAFCLVQLRVTDPDSAFAECTASVDLRDLVPPVLTCPSNQSSECGGPGSGPAARQAWLNSATATDACSGPRPVTTTLVSSTGPCAGTFSEIHEFRAQDACGNVTTCRRTWAETDSTPPVVQAPPDRVVECTTPASDLAAWLASATASDACAGQLPVVTAVVQQLTPCRGASRTRYRFSAVDPCGNEGEAFAWYETRDTVAPSLVGVPPDQQAACDAVPPPATVTATDACDPAPVVTFSEQVVPGACPQERVLVRTWTARDDCGNAASRTQRVTVVDQAPPTLLGVPADQQAPCHAIPPPAGVTATDTCDPAPVVTLSEQTQPGPCPQESVIVRTWTARDACGNTASRTQRITVVDQTPPTLVGVPADQEAPCDAIPPPPAVTATDACDPAPVVTFSQTTSATHAAAESAGGPRRFPGTRGSPSVPAAHCPDEYTIIRTWTATDACGNQASRTQTITVVDRVAPTLTGVPPDTTVPCTSVPPPAAVTAVDACDPDPVVVFGEVRVDGPCPGTYSLRRTWTATDRCGNASSARQTVQVVDDIPPVVSPPAAITVECPAPASGTDSETEWRSRATATDSCGPATPQSAEVSRTPRCGATYQAVFEFWATDACGNESSRLTRTYTVEDTTPPVLSAPADLTVECPAPASGPGSESAWRGSATATDGCGTPTVQSSEVSRTPGCGATYVAVFEFWATDPCGNESPRVRRTYRVVDTTPPILNAPADLTIECPAPASGPGSEADWRASATATDACGTATPSSRELLREPGCGNTYTATFEFWATDECGNESARVTRRYIVVDTTPPVFSQPGPDQFLLSIWPPNHGYVVYQTADLVSATDTCGEVVVSVTGCRSSQPEEVHQGPTSDGGNGDGHFGEDCVLSVDGTQFAVRAERLGACGRDSFRVYSVEFTATDECGNGAPGQGRIIVEHDRSGHQDVRRGRKLGPNDPPPFPYTHPTVYGTGCGP